MKITKAMIDKAERKGACADAITWLREKPRTLKELFEHDRSWSSWAVAKEIVTISQVGRYWSIPYGTRVKLVGNTALGSGYEDLKKGMRGTVKDSGLNIGVDLGPDFEGHHCNSLPRPTGFWFNRNELRVIRKGKKR